MLYCFKASCTCNQHATKSYKRHLAWRNTWQQTHLSLTACARCHVAVHAYEHALAYACDIVNLKDPDPLAAIGEDATDLHVIRSTWQRPEQQYKKQCCCNEANRAHSNCSTHLADTDLKTHTHTHSMTACICWVHTNN